MFFCNQCHLFRGHSKEGQNKDTHQWNDIHDVIENEIENGIGPQFGDAHDKSDRRKINLSGADHCTYGNDESGAECGQETSFKPSLLPDDLVDLLSQTHGELEFPFCHLTSPKENIVIKAYHPEC